MPITLGLGTQSTAVMSTKSSFLPRLGLSRGDGPILPLHRRTSPPPVRKQPSEYDLSDLSPRPDDALLSSEPMNNHKSAFSPRRSPPPSPRYSDRASNAGSSSKSKPNQRVLFAGPPPPIAVSQVLYRDEEERETSLFPPRSLQASSFARNINSVLFDRSSSSPNRTRDRDYDPNPDAVWLNLQRRERALQKELQHLLDAQSAGLAANLDPNAQPPPSSSSAPSEASDAGTTNTGSPSTRPRGRHVTFDDHHPTAVTASGTPIPVRQPRPKPPSLRAARAGLARTVTLLADLKADEDARLTATLSRRKQALSQLRRWAARRDGIAEELRILEEDGEEPLGRELRELEEEREGVGREIAELEGRLRALKKRRKALDERVGEVRSRREAGLSGYRGALREVEGKIGGLLSRPGVRPLDGEFFTQGAEVDGVGENGVVDEALGVEFLRLRPERRTAEMAREWWEGEVAILERRKVDVDKERAALEEGVEVWKGAVKLVSDFETGLRKEMNGDTNINPEAMSNHKGKAKEAEPPLPSPPEHAMYAQLDKMRAVITGLEEHLHIAEENGWNLLICAIGAELEAFRQAENMLRDALRMAGFDVGDDAEEDQDNDQGDLTPHLGRSTSLRDSSHRMDEAEPSGGGRLVDLHEGQEGLDEDGEKEPESDNEVPPDLLVAAREGEEHGLPSPVLSREDSNEVPAEFLREHDQHGGYPRLGS